MSSPSPVLCLCSQIPGKPTCSIRSCYLSLKAQRPDDEYRFTLKSWDIPPPCPSYSHSACNYVIPPPHPPPTPPPRIPPLHTRTHSPQLTQSLTPTNHACCLAKRIWFETIFVFGFAAFVSGQVCNRVHMGEYSFRMCLWQSEL